MKKEKEFLKLLKENISLFVKADFLENIGNNDNAYSENEDEE